MEPAPSVHSCAHRSLGKWSCHLRARHDVQILADVNVTLHKLKERSVVESAVQRNLAGITLHATETFGANNDDVSVWELVGLELCVAIQTNVARFLSDITKSPSLRRQCKSTLAR